MELDSLDIPRLDLAHLECPFTVEEVEKIVKAMPLDKAPGLDGFTGRFFASCWHIIKIDFMKALEVFYRGDMQGLPAINKAIVSLLPKVDGAVDLKDFRHVSLVHGAIKIFDKILATRLSTELPKLVGIHQSAFIKGRSLHDNFMLVQCTTRRLHALKEPMILLKLDLMKAFDSVQWPFLLEVLSRMVFGPKWRSWICGLLANSSTRILVNGVPGRTILNCCGLRQGDPLSPMLFILIMEPLQKLFQLATEHGLLSPLARSGLKQRVSTFADDMMIFLKPREVEMRACAAIMRDYGEASGLLVNLVKSRAMPIRCLEETMEMICTLLGCSIGTFPCTYLGLPLTIRKQSSAHFEGLVSQLEACLPTWRATLMPKSGRFLLVKSVLCAIPIHSMLALDIPPKTPCGDDQNM